MMAHEPIGEAFTIYGWSVCSWILVVAFQYGYHISALNQIQAVLTCNHSAPEEFVRISALPTCISMSDFTFSIVTSIFTVGGLLGSMVANLIMDRWGRKGTTQFCAFLIASGAAIMGLSSSVFALATGRFLIGIGSGTGTCVIPIYLAEIAPSQIRGNVGVLTQLAIVFGIMTTQAAGLRLATPTQWRIVLLISFSFCAAQLLLSPFIAESPAWLIRAGNPEESAAVGRKLWQPHSNGQNRDVEDDPLLGDPSDSTRRDAKRVSLTVPGVFSSRDLRKPLIIVCSAMLSQQLSGINSVLYYSNSILSTSLPDLGPYVSLGITIVNVLMTFPPIILIERMGRRALLSVSIFGALVSLAMAGFGLNHGLATLTSVAIITFVMSFAVGLGPVPYVMIPEVSPEHAVSALSSIALSLNWITNFFVGLTFLPLRDWLSGGSAAKEGRVFYLFAILLSASAIPLLRKYK